MRNTNTISNLMRTATAVAMLAVFAAAVSAALAVTVETQEEPQTLLLVKTTPAGAEVWLDGNKVGLSGDLLDVKPGTYRLVVDMAGHKPSKQKITIEDGRITRIEMTLARVGADSPTAQFASRNTLKYDDDKADGKKSLGGSGEMIRFTLPEGNWKVKGIQLHGSRYGYPQPPAEDFLIYFLDKNFDEVASEEAPYRLFKRGNPKWVPIRFKEPVEVPEEFWVCVNFNAGRTKGVFVSYDTSSGGKHSKTGLPGQDAKDVDFGGDWMIRVDLVPAGEATSSTKAKRQTLKHDDDKADGKKSIAGSGEIIKYTLPDGEWTVQGIRIHGSRYGYPQPPAESIKIYLLDEDLKKVIATRRAPYRLFNRGKERWVRIRFKKPVDVPDTFWVCVDFNAERTKGVFVSHDTSTGGKFSKTGLPEGEKRDVTFGGDWMIRVDVAPASSGSTSSLPTRNRTANAQLAPREAPRFAWQR